MLDEEDGDAIVGSPRVKQQISMVQCGFHHKSSQSDQADDAERACSSAARDQPLDLISKKHLKIEAIVDSRCNSL
jgi:hypothetical protein